MLRFFKLRIEMKLGILSGLGILAAGLIAVSQIMGDARVTKAIETANIEQSAAHDAAAATSAQRNMQIVVRDIRLAATPETMRRAVQRLEEGQKAAHKYLDPIATKLPVPEIRALVQQSSELTDRYVAGAKEIAKIRNDALGVDAASAPEAAARLRAINAEAERYARDNTLKIVAELDEIMGKIDQTASDFAKKEIANAENEMATVERNNLMLVIFAIAVLIGSAAFGMFGIARPLGRMARVLTELTNDRIVDVPYVGRGDEIGDIAAATDVFKASIAEKATNYRVRLALDEVRTNVMLADDQYNIIYMNNSLAQMMKEAESDIRKDIPALNASKLIGTNIDTFHKNPAHQRRILDGLAQTFETDLEIGGRSFHLVVTPVIQEGTRKRLGTIVEWQDRTAIKAQEAIERAVEREIDGVVQAAVAGDFSRRVPAEGKKGFMLNLTNAMNGLCDNTEKALSDLARVMSSLAEGDLTQRISANYQGMFDQLKNDANTMADRIGATIAEIKSSAREVTNASAEISTSTTDLSQRTEEQAASLEETSASMEQISATVKKNAENAQEANQSAASTCQVADRGGQVVAHAVDAMAKIEESSRKISDIIGVIDEIARQTNLLALNAAVEAARAGDAGRGFAVVASEVRSLAQRSSQAAKDIKDLITSSNGQVKDGVDLVNRAGTALNEIVESIKKVADIVADIASASNEQASGIEQVNKALTQMDEVTQQNSALVEENAATAKTLEHQAKAMNDQVAFFRLVSSAVAEKRQPVEQAKVMPLRQKAAAGAPVKGGSGVRPAAASGSGAIGRLKATLATAFERDPDWEEF